MPVLLSVIVCTIALLECGVRHYVASSLVGFLGMSQPVSGAIVEPWDVCFVSYINKIRYGMCIEMLNL